MNAPILFFPRRRRTNSPRFFDATFPARAQYATAFSKVELPEDVAGAGNDFEAIENIRRLAFADQVEAPQQLSLWQADADQTETGK
jgi:hypothetical protein